MKNTSKTVLLLLCSLVFAVFHPVFSGKNTNSPPFRSGDLVDALNSNEFALPRKVAVLKLALKLKIPLDDNTKSVVKNFLLRWMTTYRESSGKDKALSQRGFLDLFKRFGFALTQKEYEKHFTIKTFKTCSDDVFMPFFELFMASGLYTGEFACKYRDILNAGISAPKKGILLQFLYCPPYKKSDILDSNSKLLKELEGERRYNYLFSYYSQKSDSYENEAFYDKYAKIFFDCAMNSDAFLLNAGVLKEICWDGLVINATCERENDKSKAPSKKDMAELFSKRLNLIVKSNRDDIILQYLNSLKSGETDELAIIPEKQIYGLAPLLNSKNEKIIEAAIEVLNKKTGKNLKTPDAWKKAIEAIPEDGADSKR